MADQALRLGGAAPELDATGLKLVGGRLLPGPTGPASFLMYESASGERFTVYTAKADAETTQMRYAARDKDGALFWADRGVGYVVSGGTDRERLTQVARLVYDATEKHGGTDRSPDGASAIRATALLARPNSDIENLESGSSARLKIAPGDHAMVRSRSIRRSAQAASTGVLYRAGPPVEAAPFSSADDPA